MQSYLDRIEAYDKQGPYLNSIITVSEHALGRARELDAAFRESGFTGPLHGIPVIVKDNYDTHDLPTTNGTLAFRGAIPPDDAYQVRKLREAGAIVLAKSNLAEFASSGAFTLSSVLPGFSRNPYDPTRVTAGSSGGRAPRSPPTSAPWGSAPTPEAPSAVPRRIRRWWDSAPPWG